MSFLDKIPEVFKNRRQIWEGLRNKAFKNEDVEKVYEARMEICRDCRLYDTTGAGCAFGGSICCNKNMGEEVDGLMIYGCGCNLTLKGRSLSSACPLGKWTAVLTLQEEEMLKKQLFEKDTRPGGLGSATYNSGKNPGATSPNENSGGSS